MIGSTRLIFIDAQFIRDNTVVNDNVDTNIIEKSIRTSMDKYIHPLIGSGLYESLIDKCDDNSITAATNSTYKELLDEYVIPCLTEYTVYELVPFLNYKFKNKSISTQNSPDSTSAGLDELNYLRDNIKDTAQFYGERMVQYLKKNSSQSQFTEYYTWSIGTIPPANGDYFNGIHIPNSSRNSCGGIGYGFGININY